MHQSLGLSRIGFAGSQLGELGLKAWMGRDMDIRREGCRRHGHAYELLSVDEGIDSIERQ